MTPADYAFLQRHLKDRSGLILGEDKTYLVESRLSPVARKAGRSLAELVAVIRSGRDPALDQAVVEAMTINESYFFRDKTPFENFENEMLPHLLQARRAERRIRIWCAACSTGQEPYSLAMILRENAARLAGWRVEIVATDLASGVVERAREGLFNQFDVQRGLPIKLLTRYFTQEGDKWRIDRAIREAVSFRPMNLLRDFGPLGTFDVIFCRNVLIYFDEAAKRDILNRASRQCADDGFLVMGAAESTVGLCTSFQPHAKLRGVFVRPPAPAPAAALRPNLVAPTFRPAIVA